MNHDGFVFPGRDDTLSASMSNSTHPEFIDDGSFGWPKIGDEVLVDSFAVSERNPRHQALLRKTGPDA